MTERPIPFTAPMVRALLAGTKTQTRRAVKPQPNWTEPATVWEKGDGHSGLGWYAHHSEYPEEGSLFYRCPYGQPGDRLWVREAWRAPASCDHLPPRSIADSEARRFIADEIIGPDPGFGKLRQGMFMPRWASRILLEVTNIRAERLQDISEADAVAEGIAYSERFRGYCLGMAEHFNSRDPRESYLSLWNAINGAGSSEKNPWVWAVSFRLLAGGLQP